MLDKAECYLHEKFQRGSPSKFLRQIDSKLAPCILGSFDFSRHCNWDCLNSEPISPRRKNSFEQRVFVNAKREFDAERNVIESCIL